MVELAVMARSRANPGSFDGQYDGTGLDEYLSGSLIFPESFRCSILTRMVKIHKNHKHMSVNLRGFA